MSHRQAAIVHDGNQAAISYLRQTFWSLGSSVASWRVIHHDHGEDISGWYMVDDGAYMINNG